MLSWKNSLQPLLLSASYLPYLPSFVEWILYLILLLEIWLKLKFIYLYMYYEILVYWVLLAHFVFTLLLIVQCFFLLLLFFCFIYLFFFNRSLFKLSIPFRKLTRAAIKGYSAKYVCLQFGKRYKIM